jgi:hypothetical protein
MVGNMNVRARIGFGVGNLVAAALLVAAWSALPVRHLAIDGGLVAVAVLLALSSLPLFANAAWAVRALRLAAYILLTLGLGALGLGLLTIAFLSGVHGRWLDGGMLITVQWLALLVPYTVVYPVVQLLWSQRAQGEAAA